VIPPEGCSFAENCRIVLQLVPEGLLVRYMEGEKISSSNEGEGGD
jgi:hypothetical protein